MKWIYWIVCFFCLLLTCCTKEINIGKYKNKKIKISEQDFIYPIKQDNKFGIINVNGKIITEPIYDEINKLNIKVDNVTYTYYSIIKHSKDSKNGKKIIGRSVGVYRL